MFMGIPTQAETLADAVGLAYRTNPTLESSRYDVRAADEGIVQARSELRPTADLEVTGSYDRTVEGRASSSANPFVPEAFNSNSNQIQIVLTQPLYTGGRATADREAAEANVRSRRETLRSSEGDLLLGVITDYVDVRRYAATLEVWKASVVELGKLTKEIEARQVAGELTHTDMAQAESQLDLAREQVTASEQNLEGARSDYAALVGRNPGVLDIEPQLPQIPQNVNVAFDLAEQLNPELANARCTELASRDDIVVARAAGRPTVGLRGTAALNGKAVPYHLRDQDQGFVGSVVFTLPLTEGGRTASLIRQAQDRNNGDRFRIEAARRLLDRNVSNVWNQMVTAERQVGLLEQQRRAAATQLDGMINEYRVGLRSTFDVLYAEQSLRDTEVSLLGARRDRYVAEATLLRQTGLLEANTILTGVDLYNPERHLKQVDHKNALPWDPVVAVIDRVGKPGAHQPALAPSVNGPGQPYVGKAGPPPIGAALSRSVPIAPFAGNAGEAAQSPDRKLH